jgi:hypothetical protein
MSAPSRVDAALPEGEALAAEVARLVLGTLPPRAPGGGGDVGAILAGLDSLGRLELLAALEERFDVELTEDLISEFESTERIARILLDVRSDRNESIPG